MVLNKPVLSERIKDELAEIAVECSAVGCDLAERLTVEIHQARRALAFVQERKRVPGDAEKYVIKLHKARISAFELELLKLAEPSKV